MGREASKDDSPLTRAERRSAVAANICSGVIADTDSSSAFTCRVTEVSILIFLEFSLINSIRVERIRRIYGAEKSSVVYEPKPAL